MAHAIRYRPHATLRPRGRERRDDLYHCKLTGMYDPGNCRLTHDPLSTQMAASYAANPLQVSMVQ